MRCCLCIFSYLALTFALMSAHATSYMHICIHNFMLLLNPVGLLTFLRGLIFPFFSPGGQYPLSESSPNILDDTSREEKEPQHVQNNNKVKYFISVPIESTHLLLFKSKKCTLLECIFPLLVVV